MSRTCFGRPSNSAHGWRFEDGVFKHEPALPSGYVDSMGGLWSTADDLCRWITFLCEPYFKAVDSRDSLLSLHSRREMQQAHNLRSAPLLSPFPAESSYGYGLSLTYLYPLQATVLQHSGGLPGYGSNMMWHKESGIGIVSLGNITYAPMSSANQLALAKLNAFSHLQLARPSLSSPLHVRGAALCRELVASLNSFTSLSPEDVDTIVTSVDQRVKDYTENIQSRGILDTSVLTTSDSRLSNEMNATISQIVSLFSHNALLDTDIRHRIESMKRCQETHGILEIERINGPLASEATVELKNNLILKIQFSPALPLTIQFYNFKPR